MTLEIGHPQEQTDPPAPTLAPERMQHTSTITGGESMNLTATSRATSLFCMLAAFAIMATPARAQDPVDVGSEFIYFVDGLNVLVPGLSASIADDPLNVENKALRFGYGDFGMSGMTFNTAVGADMTAMVAETAGAGKTLYLRMLVDPILAGRGICNPADGGGCLSLTLLDAITGPQDAAAIEAGTSSPEMRLKWFITEDLKDGAWHDLAIPLPPTTIAALDSAKVGKNADGSALASPLDDLAMNWKYSGAWAGGFGIGCCGSAGTGSDDPLFQEFSWDAVGQLGIQFDFNDGGGGEIFIDDIYIGDASTDLGAASGAPSAMSAVTFAADGAKNVVSWTHNPAFGGYNVYADENPITTARLIAGEVSRLGTVAFNASSFGIDHVLEVPHPSMAPLDVYYAVTSTSLFGVENTDVSASAGSIANGDLASQAFIMELTTPEADLVFDDLQATIAGRDAFPAGTVPFNVDLSHWSASEGGLPDNNDDVSGSFWIGFNREYGELYFYGEVKDDIESLHPGTSACNGCEAWGYDSVEIGWGSYDVRDVDGGSILGGSPHENYGRVAEPDVQLRFSNLATGLTSTFASAQAGAEAEGEVPGGGSVFAPLLDGTGATIGYKFLSLMPYAGFAFPATGDEVFTPPALDGVKLIPFNIAINDGDTDGQNPRDTQVQWSTKPNATNQWWNTPAQWLTVAVAGRATATPNEEEIDLPLTYALGQNYPNPFNPATTIDFSLAAGQNVSLTVYNVLGQKVATLVNGDMMNAGSHQVRFDARNLTSGMYLVRLEAGTAYTQTRSMMLLK
jgi:Secretion system C-terminal sorting domain